MLDQLRNFDQSVAYRSEQIRLKVFGTRFDKACFLSFHGLEFNNGFQQAIKHALRPDGFRIFGGLKTNLARIALKIQLNEFEKDGALRITDMVRCIIVVDQIPEANAVFARLKRIDCITIIRIENNIKEEVPNVVLNVIYDHSIIGEIIIRVGDKPANYYAMTFLDNLAESYSALEFREHLWHFCNRL